MVFRFITILEILMEWFRFKVHLIGLKDIVVIMEPVSREAGDLGLLIKIWEDLYGNLMVLLSGLL